MLGLPWGFIRRDELTRLRTKLSRLTDAYASLLRRNDEMSTEIRNLRASLARADEWRKAYIESSGPNPKGWQWLPDGTSGPKK